MVNTYLYEPMTCRMRPCFRRLDQRVLDGIVMYILDVLYSHPHPLSDVPKNDAADCLFVFILIGSPRSNSLEFVQASFAEIAFNLPPTHGKSLSFSDNVLMQWRWSGNKTNVYSKAMGFDNSAKGISEQYDTRLFTQYFAPVVCYHSKRETCPLRLRSAISHCSSISCYSLL